MHCGKTINNDSLLELLDFKKNHPFSEYILDVDRRISELKGELLADMRQHPFKYRREEMYSYISSGALTIKDLVDDNGILTDRSFSQIKRYPRLQDEQREVPVSVSKNPHSEDGNADIYIFGLPGCGKSCLLAGMLSLTGHLGFSFDPKGPGGAGAYALKLRNYARCNMLPPSTHQTCIQVIDAEITNLRSDICNLSLIEMPSENMYQLACPREDKNLEDLGPGASALLQNDNYKLLFFIIDPQNEMSFPIEKGDGQSFFDQKTVIKSFFALLSKYPNVLRKVRGLNFILTKSDSLDDSLNENIIKSYLDDHGYSDVFKSMRDFCIRFDININIGFNVGIYPFSIGKFMPGEVYTFDETDSLKILRVIQQFCPLPLPEPYIMSRLREWFNK